MTVGAWEHCLTVLQASGWAPAGTLSDGLFWDGSYLVPVGQTVTDQDARGMALVARGLWDGQRASWPFLLIADVAGRGSFRIDPYAVKAA